MTLRLNPSHQSHDPLDSQRSARLIPPFPYPPPFPVLFTPAQPEPEFESEGTAELLGIEVGHKGDGYRDNSRFGSSQKYLDGTSFGGDGGGDEDGGRSVPVVLHAGSYRLPAEAFLGPPKPFTTAWAGFQTVWSGLPYAHAFPVESRRGRGSDGSGACGSRAAMAAVACPRGNTDYAVSEAWAFEAWDGTPVLCTLTAMKAPFSFGAPTAGGYSPIWGGAGGIVSWFGRMEMRCGSYACLEFAQMSPDRLARFVTGGVFLPRMVESQQQQQQLDSFGRGTDKVNSDWFSRTDISAPEPLAQQSSSALSSTFREDAAATKGRIAALVRALREREYVDTTRAA